MPHLRSENVTRAQPALFYNRAKVALLSQQEHKTPETLIFISKLAVLLRNAGCIRNLFGKMFFPLIIRMYMNSRFLQTPTWLLFEGGFNIYNLLDIFTLHLIHKTPFSFHGFHIGIHSWEPAGRNTSQCGVPPPLLGRRQVEQYA